MRDFHESSWKWNWAEGENVRECLYKVPLITVLSQRKFIPLLGPYVSPKIWIFTGISPLESRARGENAFGLHAKRSSSPSPRNEPYDICSKSMYVLDLTAVPVRSFEFRYDRCRVNYTFSNGMHEILPYFLHFSPHSNSVIPTCSRLSITGFVNMVVMGAMLYPRAQITLPYFIYVFVARFKKETRYMRPTSSTVEYCVSLKIQNTQTAFGIHTASYSMGTRSLSRG